MKCQYCGTEIKNDKAMFCFKCGNSIKKGNEPKGKLKFVQSSETILYDNDELYTNIEKKANKKAVSYKIPKIDAVSEKEKIHKNKIIKDVLLFVIGFLLLDAALGIGIYFRNKKLDNVDQKEELTTDEIAKMENTEDIVVDGDDIYIYSYNEEFGNYLHFFYEKYPQYEDKVKYKIVGDGCGDRYFNDLIAAYNSDEKPSIVIYDADYLDYLFDYDKFYSMDEIGITDEMCSDMFPFTIESATYAGKLMGLSWQACPGCFCYRMDIAENVFGSSDPSVIGEYFSTWDGVLKAGEMLKNAGYYLVPETTGVIRSMGNNYNPDVVNIMKNNGYSKELLEWSTDWQMSFESDVFGYFGCTWFGWVIGYGDLVGNIGICTVPDAYYWGGGYLGVTRECSNTDLAMLVIYTLCCDSDVMYEMGINSESDVPNNFTSIQRMIDNGVEPWNHEIIGTKGVLNIYYDVGKKCELRTDNQVTCYLTDIAINTEQDDYYSNVQWISKNEKRYYHFTISGIIDNKGVNVSYCVNYSDGTSEWSAFDDQFYNNYSGSISVTCYSAGMESIDVYVSYGDDIEPTFIGTMSIQITD